MMELKPALEYVNGKNRLSACKFTGNIGIGKSEPVVDNCNTSKARATNRPTLPPTVTKKNAMAMKVKLVKMENNIKEGILAT